MSDKEVLLDKIWKVLGKESASSTKSKTTAISAASMSRKLKIFNNELYTKKNEINNICNDYVKSKSLSKKEIEALKLEIEDIFRKYIISFNK